MRHREVSGKNTAIEGPERLMLSTRCVTYTRSKVHCVLCASSHVHSTPEAVLLLDVTFRGRAAG
jgi:hypothetical protein